MVAFWITLQKELYEFMSESFLLDQVQILYGPNQSVIKDWALIRNGKIEAFGNEAKREGLKIGLEPISSSKLLLAPCLVDPHSILNNPIKGKSENLASLRKTAANCGYGQIALIPTKESYRDAPEQIQGFNTTNSDVIIHLWGSFSKSCQGKELAPHADLLREGAIGIAESDSMIPFGLLSRGFLLGEIGVSPILIAPRDLDLQANGIVRESVETLRAGWHPDPTISETVPLHGLLEIHKQFPNTNLRLMNISTEQGVAILREAKYQPMSTTSWWHLIADSKRLSPTDLGWRVTPSLGRSEDRLALIDGLIEGLITAISVNATPIDSEENELPNDLRPPGISGHHLVLPTLWQELIVKAKIPIEKLWEFISFGPSKILNLKEECLTLGSRRWLLFDPEKVWVQNRKDEFSPQAANQPWEGRKIVGKVISCGLNNEISSVD